MKQAPSRVSTKPGLKTAAVMYAMAMISSGLVFYCYQALRPIFPLPLLAFVPILITLSLATSIRSGASLAFVSSISFGLLTLFGFENYGLGAYFAAAMFLGSQYFFYFIFFLYLRKRSCCALVQAVLSATGFIAIDFFYSNLHFGPTGRYAATLSYDLVFAQIVGITGPAGLSFALIFANTIFAQALLNFGDMQRHYKALLTVVALFLAIYGYGRVVMANPQPESTAIDFAIIQGGITKQQYDAMPSNYRAWALVRDRYFNMTREAHAMGYRNILWPETAIRSYVGVKEDLAQLLKSLNQPLFGGFPFLIEESEVQFNSALQLDVNAEVIGRYDKNHLLLNAEAEFTSGEGAEPIIATFQRNASGAVASVSVAAPICLEVLFPNFVRAMSNKGAELIIVLTNDAGFRFTAISALVQKQAVLRAIENNKYLIRVAQSGISSVIDNRGSVIVQTGLMEQKIVPATARLSNAQSVYGKLGEWFLLLMVLISGALFKCGTGKSVMHFRATS